MLSRSSSLTDRRLRRAKSTSSAHQHSQNSLQVVYEQLGPVGQRQAQAAAHHAFQLARSRDNLKAGRIIIEPQHEDRYDMRRSQSHRSFGQSSSNNLPSAGMIPGRYSSKRLSLSSTASHVSLDRTQSLKRTMRAEEPSQRYSI